MVSVFNSFVILLVSGAMVASSLIVHDIFKGPRSCIMGFDSSLDQKFESIVDGSTAESVQELLGEPVMKTDYFNLPQENGFEDQFKNTENSEATYYLQWHNGSNWYYCIGFDANDTVVIKGSGHS